MARLNEAPQPAVESIDALKRRFVRQNREIARANSTQSLRIRSLESEVSRLLSENVSLREQIIKLQYEIERNNSQSIEDNVTSVKAKLEEKLAELGVLVKELGQVQKNTRSRRASKGKIARQSSPQRSPDQRNWKNVLTLSEATGGTDGRLPPIMEDKYYPRRTMDPEQLMGVLTDPANVTDSPDLGPPPVAHFEEGDPIKFDPKPERPSTKTTSGSREQSRPLPANLETRKKRRESSHHRDTGDKRLNLQDGEEAAPRDLLAVKGQPLKTSAKRKLDVRDEEEQTGRSGDQEMFHFRSKTADLRTSESAAAKPTITRTSKHSKERLNQAATASTQARKDKATEAPTANSITNRKALGPKSANTDPANSPVKSKINGKDRIAEVREELVKINRERAPQKEKAPISKSTSFTKDQGPAPIATSTIKNVDLPPETPASANDILSPVSTEPSADRAESRDTPPPPDLGPDTGTGSFGRASRRSRGSINYAQPNLRDKMRRPTSELVDAVGAEERLRQANLARTERENMASVAIKQENTDALPMWKTNNYKDDQRTREEPTSPLSNKTSGSAMDLPGSVITERRRRSVAPSRGEDINELSMPSGAASAIAALTAGTHRSKRVEKDSDVIDGKDRLREPEERLSIFDFTGSSPADPGGHTSDKDEKTTKPMRSGSRRHSSVAASSDQGPGSLSISRRMERRRESVLSTRREENSEKGIDSQLSRTRSVIELGAGDPVDPELAGEEASSGRGERAASRRRSMML